MAVCGRIVGASGDAVPTPPFPIRHPLGSRRELVPPRSRDGRRPLAGVGGRDVREGADRAQADLPFDRLLRMPLVSRHADGVVREWGRRGAFERALHPGPRRSRGDARRRRDLRRVRAGDERRQRGMAGDAHPDARSLAARGGVVLEAGRAEARARFRRG